MKHIPGVKSIALIVMLTGGVSLLQAQETDRQVIEIAPQPLASALLSFSRQTGLQLAYLSTIAEGIQSPGANGTKTPDEALQSVLAGTGLQYRFINEHTVAIKSIEEENRQLGKSRPTSGQVLVSEAEMSAKKSQDTTVPAESKAVEEFSGGQVIEEVVVTARHREETPQDMGMAINVFGGNELESSPVDFGDLVRRSPGLDVTMRGPNKSDISIRGMANATGNDDLSRRNPLIGLYLDDVPVATPFISQRSWNLFDLNRVEVVLGPQGLLYGEGAMSGAVRYVTNDPALDAFQGKIRVSLSNTQGSDGLNRDINAAVNIPLIADKLALRLVGFYRYDDGFIDFPVANQKDANDYESTGGRVVVLGQLTEALQVRVSATFEDSNSGSDWITTTGPVSDFVNENALTEPIDDTATLISAKVTYETDIGAFTSITGYLERDQDEGGFDWTTTGFLEGLLTTKSFVLTNEQFTQELRFRSGFNGPFNLTLGAFYKKLDSMQDLFAVTRIAGTDLGSFDQEETYEGEHYSGFAEVTFEATERLTLSAGVRYFREDVEVLQVTTPQPLFPFGGEDRFGLPIREWLPKFGVEYNLQDDWLLYGVAGRGARNGSTNDSGIVLFSNLSGLDTTAIRTYGPDTAWSYELGTKMQAFDDRLTASLALYYTDWSDFQAQRQTQPLVLLGGLQLTVVSNAEEAESKGVEFSTRYQFSDDFAAFVAGNLTEAEVSKDSIFDPVTGDITPAGADIPNVPNYTLSLGADYSARLDTFPGGATNFTAHADFQLVGRTKHTLANTASPPPNESPSYGIFNIRAGLETEGWMVNLFAKNLFNKVIPFYRDGPGLVNVQPGPGLVGVAENQFYIGRSRTVGISASVNF